MLNLQGFIWHGLWDTGLSPVYWLARCSLHALLDCFMIDHLPLATVSCWPPDLCIVSAAPLGMFKLCELLFGGESEFHPFSKGTPGKVSF